MKSGMKNQIKFFQTEENKSYLGEKNKRKEKEAGEIDSVAF